MTLGDKVYNYYDKYIRKTPTKESKIKSSPMYSSEMLKAGDDPTLTPDRRRELAHQSPIFMKGVRKKCMDSVRAWFELETWNGSKPVDADINALRAFEKRSNYRKKFTQACKDAHVYGDGFLLIQFDAKDKGFNLSQEPALGSEPRDVMVICPEKIKKVDYLSEANRAKDFYHYIFNDGDGDKPIHPDRIQHVIVEEDSNSKLGLSKIDLLRNTIKSKRNVDIAVGRILSWFSHGMLDVKVLDLEDDEIKEIKKVAQTHPSAWIHDPEDFEIEVVQPQAIDPKSFMDFLILNIAGALIMPMHILTGIQVGKVTGAEIGTADYYRDIRDMQELVYTPLIENMYQRIIEARGRVWKYDIKWKTVYVDELGEAIIMEKRSTFVTSLYDSGLIDLEEARNMLNEGLYPLEVGKKIKVKKVEVKVKDEKDDKPTTPPTKTKNPV